MIKRSLHLAIITTVLLLLQLCKVNAFSIGSRIQTYPTQQSHNCGTYHVTNHRPYHSNVIFKRVSLKSSEDDFNSDSLRQDDPLMIADDPIFNGQTTLALVGSQSLLVVGSVIAAIILEIPNFGLGETFLLDGGALQQGAIATAPLLLLAAVLDIVEKSDMPGSSALLEVTRATNQSVLALFGGTRKPFLALLISLALGLAAGIGEELLFRGILQTALMERFGDIFALSSTAVIFGALHAVTPLYAFLASLASGYFGTLYIQADNLAVPIICHTVYDVAALMWSHFSVTALPLDERLELAGMREPSNDN